MRRLRFSPRRMARLDALLTSLRVVHAVHRDDLQDLAAGLDCTYRSLLCDVLALVRMGLAHAANDTVYASPLAALAAA